VPLRVLQGLWRYTSAPRIERFIGPIDVCHVFDLVPAPARAPIVLTVHDLAAVEHPDLHSERQVALQRKQLAAAKVVATVIAVSASTAGALARAGIDPERIVVTPLGSTPMARPGERVVDGPFLLAVGELAARKNLPMLIQAFNDARLPAELELVLAGPLGYRGDEVVRLAGPRIRILGSVDDATLAALYRDAVALCFPSFAEGFGLPVLEALHDGLPVVASDIGPVREIVEDAALLLPPNDPIAWTTALERIVADDSLRETLVNSGRQRATLFTWSRTAELTVTAYEKALQCA
jgi:glycosyltransferase involved in cell wall biosynthesis